MGLETGSPEFCLIDESRGRGRRRPYDAVDASQNEVARVQQMLGLVMFLRPSGTGVELDTEKVPDVAKHAVLDETGQLAFPILNANLCPQRYRSVYLHARTAQGNIFQVDDAFLCPAALVFPGETNHVRT